MAFVIIGLIILAVSFIIALLSLVRESSNSKNITKEELKQDLGKEPQIETEAPDSSQTRDDSDQEYKSAKRETFFWEEKNSPDPNQSLEKQTKLEEQKFKGEISIRDMISDKHD